MSTTNAKTGSAVENQASTPDLLPDQGTILAQFPDLEAQATPQVAQPRAGGRIISQALSLKLVLGLGMVLVIGAILPFVFGKASRPNPMVKELPAWSGSDNSAATADDMKRSTAPAWVPPSTAPATAVASPQAAPSILVPQPPQAGDYRPTALTDPSWSLSRPPAAPPPATTPSPAPGNDRRSPLVNTNSPAERAEYRALDRDPQADPRSASGYPGRPAPDPRTLQADSRNDAAAQYRNDARYDNRSGVPDIAAARRDVPPGGFSRDTRYDNPGSNYPPSMGPGSPLMPSSGQGPAPAYSAPQASEPGVARFEGTITNPPARTNYDRTGPSNY